LSSVVLLAIINLPVNWYDSSYHGVLRLSTKIKKAPELTGAVVKLYLKE